MPAEGAVDSLVAAGQLLCEMGGMPTTEPEVTYVQFEAHNSHDAATSFVGHWSVMRGDPDAELPMYRAELERHIAEQDCDICAYLEKAEGVRRIFDEQDCDSCGRGIDGHTIAPDALGLPHAWCKTGDDR